MKSLTFELGYPETTYPLPLPLPSPTLAQKTPGMQYKIVDFFQFHSLSEA